jgi:hypothetical protein
LDVTDVITLARSIGPLVPRNGAFRVVAASSTEFTQLREGPFVLIGAYDNIWTMRVTQDLPFGFEYDNNRNAYSLIVRTQRSVPPVGGSHTSLRRLCDHRRIRQSDRQAVIVWGRHPGGRDQTAGESLESRVPECDARKAPELGPDEWKP